MIATPTDRRPGSVTAVVVLTYVVAVASVLVGLGLLMLSVTHAELGIRGWVIAGEQAHLVSRGPVTVAVGIFSLLVGVVLLLVARGLAAGRKAAQITVTVVMVLQILSALGTTAVSQFMYTLSEIITAAAILALLWTGPAKTFFR